MQHSVDLSQGVNLYEGLHCGRMSHGVQSIEDGSIGPDGLTNHEVILKSKMWVKAWLKTSVKPNLDCKENTAVLPVLEKLIQKRGRKRKAEEMVQAETYGNRKGA